MAWTPTTIKMNKKQKSLLQPSELKQYGMGLLSRREYGAHELLQKLQAKGSQESAQTALEWLQSQNLQSDQRYASMLIRSKGLRGYGPQRIRQEMQQKRLASDAIEAAFSEFDGDWFEQARLAYEKKFRTPVTKDLKDKARRQRFLLYRGYTSDQISYALEYGHRECTNSP